MADEIILRIEHVRKAKLCARGMRGWFARHDIDFMDFLKNGMPISKAEAMNDALANRVIEVARNEVAK